MESGGNARFAALLFIGIGIFLLIYAHPPRWATLQEETARVVRIVPLRATRYNVEVVTASGTKLSCVENALRDWPPPSFNRCPISQLASLVGMQVKVWHDGEHFYQIESQGEMVLSYSAFLRFQILFGLVALLMMGLGVLVWAWAG